MLEWSEFAERLGRELAGLDRDTILIIREQNESRHYVQAMCEPDRLYAEAVSNNFLEGPLLLTPADEEVLTEAGWRPPTADWAPANWWTELPPYASRSDFNRLADMMVTALRDVQGLRRPTDLVYESFHRYGTGLIELVDFGISPADPARISESRATADRITLLPVPESAEAPAPAAAPSPPQPPRPPRPPAPHRPDGTSPEARLAHAKQQNDRVTCFELLIATDPLLVMTGPATDDRGRPRFATTTIGDGTCLTVFTSPAALAEALGDRPADHCEITFAELAAAWPDPRWSLIVNAGLPSELHLDASTVAHLDGMRRTAARAATVDAVVDVIAPRVPVIRPRHGVQLWHYDGETTAALAIYDAAATRWNAADRAPQAE